MDGFTVVAEHTRRRILDYLREAVADDAVERRGRDVGSLVNALEMPQPTVSKHLRVLREAGVVTVQVHGPRRVYSLPRSHSAMSAPGWSRTDRCGPKVSMPSNGT